MDVPRLLIQSSKVLKQSTDYIWSMVHLQRQIKDCQMELSLMALGRIAKNKDRVRDLEDEIFGCRTELQCLEVKIDRLETSFAFIQDIRDIRSASNTGALHQSAGKSFLNAPNKTVT